MKIDGRLPRDNNYPYSQIFYFITKGEPAGPAKALIDFALSKIGIEIIKRIQRSRLQILIQDLSSTATLRYMVDRRDNKREIY